MRTGMIIFVNPGPESRHLEAHLEDLEDRAAYPGADETYLACSDAELSWAWWRLVARGLGRIACVAARYDADRRAVITCGAPVRLYG